MLHCYVCGKQLPTSNTFRAHLKRHRESGNLTSPILCLQGSCKSSFATLFNFFRHLSTFHGTDVHEEDCLTLDGFSDVSLGGTQQEDGSTESASPQADFDIDTDFMQNIQTEGVSLVASLRANSSVPHSIVSDVVNSFNQMAGSLTSLIKQEVLKTVCSAGISPSLAGQIGQKLDSKLELCHKPLDFLATEYRCDAFFANHPLAVMPEMVAFGPRLESHDGSSTFVYDAFQYVSVRKTLNSLLQNVAYIEALLKSKCRHGVICDFSDGTKKGNIPCSVTQQNFQ